VTTPLQAPEVAIHDRRPSDETLVPTERDAHTGRRVQVDRGDKGRQQDSARPTTTGLASSMPAVPRRRHTRHIFVGSVVGLALAAGGVIWVAASGGDTEASRGEAGTTTYPTPTTDVPATSPPAATAPSGTTGPVATTIAPSASPGASTAPNSSIATTLPPVPPPTTVPSRITNYSGESIDSINGTRGRIGSLDCRADPCVLVGFEVFTDDGEPIALTAQGAGTFTAAPVSQNVQCESRTLWIWLNPNIVVTVDDQTMTVQATAPGADCGFAHVNDQTFTFTGTRVR